MYVNRLVIDIDNAVIFLGARNDVNELMQAMDVFLLLPRFEGYRWYCRSSMYRFKCIVSDKITEEINVTNNITYVLWITLLKNGLK